VLRHHFAHCAAPLPPRRAKRAPGTPALGLEAHPPFRLAARRFASRVG